MHGPVRLMVNAMITSTKPQQTVIYTLTVDHRVSPTSGRERGQRLERLEGFFYLVDQSAKKAYEVVSKGASVRQNDEA